jgi:CDP-diacylglycerol--glycerol-3-phosphate 3-phosphatidyltransferase
VITNLRPQISKAIAPLGAALHRAGITADALTVIGTIGATAGAFVFFTRGVWFVGTLVVWGFVMFDMLDGAVARASGRTSKFGAVLDSSCDRVVDSAVFGCIGWYMARHDRPLMFALCLFCLVLGSLTSYIRARAEGVGFTASVGIAERTERLIIVLVGTGLTGFPFRVPYVQEAALWILLVASTITVFQRLVTVYRQSKQVTPTLDAKPVA